jgi:hypothetical protein
MEKQEKVLAFAMALKLAEVSLSFPMCEFLYELKELTDEHGDDISIKQVKVLMEEINAKYPPVEQNQ